MTADHVPLHGAPDITIDKKLIVVAGVESDEADSGDSGDGDTTDTCPIEIGTQSMKPISGLWYCPEKLGELGAAILTKAHCTVLKNLS